LDGETRVTPRHAPTVGQHGTEVLREAGYSESEIARLRDLKILA
jgi:formyl-CoA transferase